MNGSDPITRNLRRKAQRARRALRTAEALGQASRISSAASRLNAIEMARGRLATQGAKPSGIQTAAVRARTSRGPASAGFRFGLGKFKLGPIDIGDVELGVKNTSRGMVGLAERAINIQRSMPHLSSRVNEEGNQVDTLMGTDLLTTLTSKVGGNVAGDILFSQIVSPSLFLYTRLIQFAALYQRYRFKKIRFFYEPIANATQSGQLIMYPDFDVDNILAVNTPANVSIAAAHQNQQITQIWEPAIVDFGQVRTFTDLFTEVGSSDTDDPRLAYQGVFYVMAASALDSGIPLGNVYVDYEVEFSIPFLNNTVAGTASSSYTGGTIGSSITLSSGIQFTNYTNTLGAGSLTISAPSPSSGNLTFSGAARGATIYVAITGYSATGPGGTYASTMTGSATNGTVTVFTGSIASGGNSAPAYTQLGVILSIELDAGATSTTLELSEATSFSGGAMSGMILAIAEPNAPGVLLKRVRSMRSNLFERLRILESSLKNLSAPGIPCPGPMERSEVAEGSHPSQASSSLQTEPARQGASVHSGVPVARDVLPFPEMGKYGGYTGYRDRQ